MKVNKTKAIIRRGETAYGVFIPFGGPSVVEMIGHIGFDYVLIDAEHGPLTPESCEHMVRAAECAETSPLARVAVNLRQNILRYLDAGAQGVMIPQINGPEEVQRVVSAVKYPPEGKRGLAAVRAADFGLSEAMGEYVRRANEQTMIVVQIETMAAVDHIRDILAVPGPDLFFIGPSDLSSAMGYPGQTQHPEVQKTIAYLVEEIQAAGKAAGTVAYDVEALKICQQRGFRMITYSIGPMLAKSGREYLAAARGR